MTKVKNIKSNNSNSNKNSNSNNNSNNKYNNSNINARITLSVGETPTRGGGALGIFDRTVL